MTESEAIGWLRAISVAQKNSLHENSLVERKEALHIAIQAISEIQQYQAINTSVIETLEKYVECAEQKAVEYDEAGDMIAVDILDIEANVYRNAIEIVKEARGALERLEGK